jgi:nucleotide-binding universal stress UspA family protein
VTADVRTGHHRGMSIVTVVVRFTSTAIASPAAGPSVADVIREVVVPLDGSAESERAVPVAVSLARGLGAGLRLLTTADDLPESTPGSYLERIAAGIAGPVETEVALDQDPAATIVECTRHEDTAVCMATHARGRVLGAIHPGVTDTVLHDARGPVVLVGPHCEARPLGDGPVLVAHDGGVAATASSIPLVELAARMRRPIRVVRVATAPSGKAADHPYAGTDQAIAPLLELARARGVEAEERIVFGTDVAAALLVEAAGASLVAMATHGRRGLDRFRQGSVTMSVAHTATVPVVTRHAADDAGAEPERR